MNLVIGLGLFPKTPMLGLFPKAPMLGLVVKKQNDFRGCKKLTTEKRYRPSLDLSGIFPPLMTPFNSDESVSYSKLKSNFEKWNKIPFRGYAIEGSTGEFPYLSREERVEVVRKASEFKSSDKLLIAGSGCESTRETIRMTSEMAECGADAVMVVTPSYFKPAMKDRSLIHHYEEVANQSPVPVILYNVPIFTGVNLSLEAISTLAQHKNIIGMKESLGDITKICNILHQTRDQDFQVLAGSIGYLLPALQLGCVGGILALGNVLGEEVCELYKLFTEGGQSHEKAVLLQKKLLAPGAAVTTQYSIPGLKAIMDVKGYYGGPVRSPLVSLLPEEFQTVKSAYSEAGYL